MGNDDKNNTLIECVDGNQKTLMFLDKWLNNGQNATRAYKELHPNISTHSASILGSRMLRKIDFGALMEIYGVGIDSYFKQLNAGHNAKKWNIHTQEWVADHKVREKYNIRIGKMLGFEDKHVQDEIDQEDMKLDFFVLKDENVHDSS